MKKRNGLKTRDFINIGIYSALYFVLQFGVGILLGFNPITYMFMYAVTAFVTAPIFILLVLKVQKKGTVLILSAIVGALFFMMGVWYGALYIWAFGICSELVTVSGEHRNKTKILIAYVIFNMASWMMSYSPLLFFKDYWYKFSAERGSDMESELMVTIFNMFTGPLGVISFVVTILCSVLGGFFGIRLLKKHFKKAGVVSSNG